VATLLIVDDDEQLCIALGEQLSAFGYQCLCAYTGEAAWEILKQNKVDLIILDVMIPGISGFELCRRIHRDSALLMIPILFMSAMNGEEEIAHAMAQGADDYQTKPFRTDQIMKRIQGLLSGQSHRSMVDELTGLPGQRWIKLEIQKGINADFCFGVVYAELVGIAEFGKTHGTEARDKAIRHIARMFQHIGPKISPLFSVAHMGGGHFVFVVDAATGKECCKHMHSSWYEHRAAFYESLGLKVPDRADKANKGALLQTMFCLTTHFSDTKATVTDIFDTLTQLRRKAQEESGGVGVFVDRRRRNRSTQESSIGK
jgi:CheY-like chemotaxis protein